MNSLSEGRWGCSTLMKNKESKRAIGKKNHIRK